MAKTKTKKVDYVFLGILAVLLLCGLAMLYSASTVISYKNFGNTSYYFLHQLAYGAGIGLLGLIVCSRIDYHFWQKVIPIAVVGSLIALILVKVPGLGFSAGGATRWVHFGPIVFQPAEIAKLAIILYVAGWMSKKDKDASFSSGVLPVLVILGLVALLILWQPDMGSMMSIVITAMVMLFAGGTKLKHLAWVMVGGFLSLLVLVKLEPYRMRRITAFLNRSIDPLGITYQINQALLAVGGGGVWGYGYGQSRQKYNYLPESIGDSIFAIMAEELGFVRILIILALFLAFALRGLKISAKAPDEFGRLLALGLVAGVAVNAVINIGSILGLMPLTGIPLPFFSYGSSALIVTLCGMGILLNISRQST
jgi:cell division protein FtsW